MPLRPGCVSAVGGARHATLGAGLGATHNSQSWTKRHTQPWELGSARHTTPRAGLGATHNLGGPGWARHTIPGADTQLLGAGLLRDTHPRAVGLVAKTLLSYLVVAPLLRHFALKAVDDLGTKKYLGFA